MELYVFPSSPRRVTSSYAAAIRAKVQALDERGRLRALKLLDGMADHFLAPTPEQATTAPRARTIASLRAAGADLCVAYLERHGSAG